MGGEPVGKISEEIFSGVSTDTRELKAGELFFCLLGNRDGHDFAKAALKLGASAVVLDRNHLSLAKAANAPGILVSDTLLALGDLARAWREKFKAPLLALTGSNGKTTTKELIKTVLSTRYRVLATEGNLNNLIGVPKTLFRISEPDEIIVVEMGMNDFGEIARLTEISQPTLGLITNIGLAHLEKLGGIDGVARAKGELFAGLSPQATALVNLADSRVAKLPSRAKKEGYGTPESGLWGEVLPGHAQDPIPLRVRIHMDPAEEILAMGLPGEHNLENILAALAVGRHFGISLAEAKGALENFSAAPSRMELIEIPGGIKLIDDCYNANPTSTQAALKTLARMKEKGRALAILGDMLELGDFAAQGHRMVGEEVGRQKIDFLLSIGQFSEDILQGARDAGMPEDRLNGFGDTDSALNALRQLPESVDWILVKGSRGSHLEKLVNFLKGLK